MNLFLSFSLHLIPHPESIYISYLQLSPSDVTLPHPLISPRYQYNYGTPTAILVPHRKHMLLARLSLALAFTSQVTAAAIPSPPTLQEISLAKEAESLSSRDASWPRTIQSVSRNDDDNHLNKRIPYYFPETVPDADEITDRSTAMQEAGLLASEYGQNSPKSIESPDAGIDTPRARMIPERDLMSELDRLEATESVWEMLPSLLPPFRFFVIASSIIAVLTVIRGCLRARR